VRESFARARRLAPLQTLHRGAGPVGSAPIVAQPQVSALAASGTSAVFLVLTVDPSEAAAARVRDVCANMPAFVRSVGRRDPSGGLSCVVAIGAEAWERIAPGRTRPAQLHAFVALTDGPRSAPATPGDLLFHIRANRRDFCHELSRIVIDKLGDAIQVIDETHGFAYMDNRDLIGFVDGTENPEGDDRSLWTVVGDEDPENAGGSYVTVQRYVTDFEKWDALPTEEQENAIGRTKADDIELDDAPPSAHKERTTIERGGEEHKIVRHNMAWGSTRESGTYFIGYARDLSVTEEMLKRMFVAAADGVYDRLVDFSRPVTGTNFFAPSLEVLEALAGPPVQAAADSPTAAVPSESTLGIGSLRSVR
jgi:putative iron-dependent peroxidase